MNACDECDEVHFFDLGDRVRLVQNHMLTGQVLDEQGWGAKYHVRLGATVTPLWFDYVELEPDPDFLPLSATEIDAEGNNGAEIINLAAVRAAGRASNGQIQSR
jgi:hypothetical protein